MEMKNFFSFQDLEAKYLKFSLNKKSHLQSGVTFTARVFLAEFSYLTPETSETESEAADRRPSQ